ncbi:hypothetical protein D9X30_2554 [Cupriavidus sp. U2]|nr:hypothetical protein D9X30_2554 [Cupriavidus sp. U2]
MQTLIAAVRIIFSQTCETPCFQSVDIAIQDLRHSATANAFPLNVNDRHETDGDLLQCKLS